MPDKQTKPALRKPAAPKPAPKSQKESKTAAATPSGNTLRLGSELSLSDLASQAGLPLAGRAATVGLKKIRKASVGAVLIKERDLLTLLRADRARRGKRARGAAKAATASPRRLPPVASKRETELLERINAGLSEPQARRLETLDARRGAETLTPAEHSELLTLVDESERLTVGRAEALVELARLRGTTVASLMREFSVGVTGCG